MIRLVDISTCDNVTITCLVIKCTSKDGSCCTILAVRELAEATRLHRNTITNVETEDGTQATERARGNPSGLKRAGVEFIDENGAAPGCGYASGSLRKRNGSRWEKRTTSRRLTRRPRIVTGGEQ